MEPNETLLTAVSQNTFQWDIPNFRALPNEVGYSIKSATFDWENADWCLLLYPNGVFSSTTRWMTLQLVRVQSLYQDDSRRVHVMFRFISSSGIVLKEMSVFKVFKKYGLCEGVLESVDRSSAEADLMPPYFAVSFSCTLEYFGTNDSAAGTSQSHETDPTETHFTTSFEETIRWEIRKFYQLPSSVLFYSDSPPVFWENAIWCLRIYPNGVLDAISRWMVLGLERQHAENQHQIHRLHVIFRIMGWDGSVFEEISRFHVFDDEHRFCRGSFESVDRDTVETEQRPPNFIASLSCTMRYFGTNDGSSTTFQSLEMEPTAILTPVSNNNFWWYIPNFFSLPRDVGYYLHSPPVFWENASWCIRIYPNGILDTMYTSIVVELVRQHAQIRHQPHWLRIVLRFMKGDGSVLDEISCVHVFHDEDRCCGGFLQSVDRYRAESEQTLPYFYVSLSCVLEYHEMDPIETNLIVVSEDNFWWDIPHFSDLPKDVGYFLKSPAFHWGNATWRLQIHPNGEFADRPRWISMEIMMENSRIQGEIKLVNVTFRILRCDGSVLSEIGECRVFGKCFNYCGALLESAYRSTAEMEQRPPNSVVSFLCTLGYVGTIDSGAGTSQAQEMEPAEASFTVVSESYFKWDIRNFSALPKDVGYVLQSPTFLWENDTWRLRLYPNGIAPNISRWIALELVREESQNQGESKRVKVTFRIISSDGTVLKEIVKTKVFRRRFNFCGGSLESVYRSTAETLQRAPDFVVSFTCTLES